MIIQAEVILALEVAAMTKEYEIIDMEFNDIPVVAIKIIQGTYAGVIYYYHGARFEENGENVILKFGFDIIDSPPSRPDLQLVEGFKNYIGDILVELIEEKLAKQEPLIFTGGTDEVGT
jgi:hypothetical protein